MQEVSIDSLQQQVRTFRGESREVRVFLWGGQVPPNASDLDRCPPCGLSVPVPILLNTLLIRFCLRLFHFLSGLVALLYLFSPSAGGGSEDLSPCFHPLFYFSPPASYPSTYPSPLPLDVSGLLWLGCWGLVTRWAAPRLDVNYTVHNGPCLILWRPPPP